MDNNYNDRVLAFVDRTAPYVDYIGCNGGLEKSAGGPIKWLTNLIMRHTGEGQKAINAIRATAEAPSHKAAEEALKLKGQYEDALLAALKAGKGGKLAIGKQYLDMRAALEAMNAKLAKGEKISNADWNRLLNHVATVRKNGTEWASASILNKGTESGISGLHVEDGFEEALDKVLKTRKKDQLEAFQSLMGYKEGVKSLRSNPYYVNRNVLSEHFNTLEEIGKKQPKSVAGGINKAKTNYINAANRANTNSLVYNEALNGVQDASHIAALGAKGGIYGKNGLQAMSDYSNLYNKYRGRVIAGTTAAAAVPVAAGAYAWGSGNGAENGVEQFKQQQLPGMLHNAASVGHSYAQQQANNAGFLDRLGYLFTGNNSSLGMTNPLAGSGFGHSSNPTV